MFVTPEPGEGEGGVKNVWKNFSGEKFFPLILPKKHWLITQKRFWPFFGVLSGFLGSPELYFMVVYVCILKISLQEKRSEVERPRETACSISIYLFLIIIFGLSTKLLET